MEIEFVERKIGSNNREVGACIWPTIDAIGAYPINDPRIGDVLFCVDVIDADGLQAAAWVWASAAKEAAEICEKQGLGFTYKKPIVYYCDPDWDRGYPVVVTIRA